ncbi:MULTISPECIES: hypothetical protein [Flavobacterium]|uniref:RHS repeat-associated core domain-containing protein n=1 Tax=Flavobacterium jumunjinense TaxID=998845 RepID=A0ABV5GIS1_9FLAO|nr:MULTISPECIES: hypothetical protein [Flavobacterium]
MKQIRSSKFSKFLAYYLAIMMLIQVTQPMQMYALTEGPSQPEFNSFTPIGTSDMVDLASGDFNYNIPIMDVGGYPLNLAYNSGVTMDQEASWVGLGWNLNVGQINRQMRGLPDDFNGDPMTYENNMKDNITIGSNGTINFDLLGLTEGGETPKKKEKKGELSVGLTVKHNNYDGLGFSITGGLSYAVSESLSVGMQMETSATEGVSASANASYNAKQSSTSKKDYSLGYSGGVAYNSRRGIESMTIGVSARKTFTTNKKKSFSTGSEGGLSYNPIATYTPLKRVAMRSSNIMFNLDLDASAFGGNIGAKFSGFMTKQGIHDSEKHKIENGFGYENTYNASERDILDFNRENDRTVNKFTNVLPITNYTFDIYSIEGQGVSGMFRPYNSQVGYVFDNKIVDKSFGGNLGIEIGAGAGHEWGFDATVTIGKSHTKLWGNRALNRFLEKKGNRPDYEKVYFKNIGGNHVDKENDLFRGSLGGYAPIKLALDGGEYGRNTTQAYYKFENPTTTEIQGNNKIARTERVNRNQAIQKLTRKEAAKYGFSKSFSKYAKDHHTAEIRIIKDGGDQYIFGKALYNHTKKEVTFDVSNKSGHDGDCSTGLISYFNSDNSAQNDRDGDRYFNRVTTPDYAHTYLLTHILSSDYQDIDGEVGPTDGDLGSYTKFTYDDKSDVSKDGLYKWRVPFGKNKANYDEGLKSSKKDDKGNYQYGEKELSYIKRIDTKTHVAIFEISARKDGFGVKDENGGFSDASKSYKLDKVLLYSKPEYDKLQRDAKPIKVAHFEYNYTLCSGIENNINYEAYKKNKNTPDVGKLTLKKVYFTYRDSNMGKYTPYVFNYMNNYSYDMKAYDVWGNYKPTPTDVSCNPTSGSMPNTEFPFVDQSNRQLADQYATAWHLESVKLPSGGTIALEYEADDYAFVQDKEAMQMFKVIGAGDGTPGQATQTNLFGSEYLYIKTNTAVSKEEFKKKYIGDLFGQPVYFRFLVNMTDPNPLPGANRTDKYDYVTGYLKLIDGVDGIKINGNEVAIKIEFVSKGDGINKGKKVNPISKAGWQFGRSYLNRLVYGVTNNEDSKDLKSIVMEMLGTLPSVLQIAQSPNGRLEDKGIASDFVSNKSWIRLKHPENRKIGGGSRVKKVQLHDEWDVMTGHIDDDVYAQFYGQEYSYNTGDGDKDNSTTSGVATYEPLGCKENPLVQPFYDRKNPGVLLGPDEQNYVEEPLGESFFPSPKVTYSRVSVKNLPRKKAIGETNYEVKKHATGHVVTEFFTSKEYPTLVKYTPLSSHYDKSNLAGILNINAKQHLTMSQGFSIHTNDMDGKMKSQRVYAEGQTLYISGVDYKYMDNTTKEDINNFGLLNNEITTINSEGVVEQNIVGVDYDVINDFRENKSVTSTYGVRFNMQGIPIAALYVIIPVLLPKYSRHEDLLKTAVTTKVMHSSGILRETIAYDLGAVVSTKNLAWDAETGQILVTETVNEYNDKYYSFNYPAYWNGEYKGMGQAVTNLDLEWNIEMPDQNSALYRFTDDHNAKQYLLPGDELWLTQNRQNGFETPLYDDNPRPFKAWVVNVADDGNITLIDKQGLRVDKYDITNGTMKVIRSGYRNLQMGSMASVTSMTNPLSHIVNNKLKPNLFDSSDWKEYRIINASAVEYSNEWAGQCECNLPQMRFNSEGELVFNFDKLDYDSDEYDNILKATYNPYVYNILGNWRAKRSYAYLTGRHHSENVTPRVSGFYEDFYPFYTYDATNKWKKSSNADIELFPNTKWTFASEVTNYNPYGQEIENKDALNRYSSALYGYNYRFPLAVASNTRYNELAYDGFEDYDFSVCDSLSHFSFEGSLDENNISISNTQSHTGRRSIRIAPSEGNETRKAIITKKIATCNDPLPVTKNTKAIQTKK